MSNLKGEYKAVIIGAGPAGLSTALNLIYRGIDDILVVERSEFPRYKCCAGYITGKTKCAYEKLGLDIEKCHYSMIKDFNIFYRLEKRLNIVNKFLYTNEKIDRVELDNSLFELAKSKGISILENTTVSSHNRQTGEITLSDGQTIRYDNLIIASGTVGFGSTYQKNKNKHIAMQQTFESEIPESIDIHFGISKHGYGWVSSYNGITNVGLTDVYCKDVDYKTVYSNFLKSLGINVTSEELKGAFTPIGIRKGVIDDNIYYVGDAVGACDPLTLSGLRYAIVCGERCAEAILRNKPEFYKKYISSLKFKFGCMKVLLKLFYLRCVLFMTFKVFCKFFGGFVSKVFNNFFVNKK